METETQLETLAHVSQSQIDEMTYSQLDSTIDDGLDVVHKTLTEMLPFLFAMKELLGNHQGQRTDLMKKKGVPEGMTWTKYVIGKKYRLGSLATVKRAMSAPKQPLLTEGTKVMDKGTQEVGVVEAVHQTDPEKVDVVFEGDEEAETVKVADLIVEKQPRVLKVSVGTLVFLEDMHGKGAEYVYKGDLKFTRTETLTPIQAKREADERKRQADLDRKAARKAELDKAKELRKAEAARKDLDLINALDNAVAEYKAGLATPSSAKGVREIAKKYGVSAKALSKRLGLSKAKKTGKRTKKTETPTVEVATSAQDEPKSNVFFVRRAVDKDGKEIRFFGVFPTTARKFTSDESATSLYPDSDLDGANAHRDRLNAKYNPKPTVEAASATA